MRYFDLHCDTVTECYVRNCGLADNELYISLKGARAYETWAQFFAVWMPDNIRGKAAWERFCGCCSVLRHETELNGIGLCCNTGELESAVVTGAKRAAILSIEGSAALGGSLSNLAAAYDMGVRMITLTWNGACEAGGGCLDGGGLSPFGFKLVTEMQRLGIVIDVSHLSDRGFLDVMNATDVPFIASHSNSRTVCNNRRNLTDEQFLEIVRRGGIVGLNLYPAFLGSGSLDSVCRHVDRFLSLGGENAIAIGADFDGASMPDGISGIADMTKLYEILRESYGESTAERIFFGNAYKFFKTVLTGCDCCNNI